MTALSPLSNAVTTLNSTPMEITLSGGQMREVGNLTVQTGWYVQGSREDSQMEMQFEVTAKATAADYGVHNKHRWLVAMSKEDGSVSEWQQVRHAYNKEDGTSVADVLHYGVYDENAHDLPFKVGDAIGYLEPIGSFIFTLSEDEAAQPYKQNEKPVESDFWQINFNRSRRSDDDKTYSMSFVRTPGNPGFLDIVNGSTLNGFVGFGGDPSLIFAKNVEFKWALEASSGDNDGNGIDRDDDDDSFDNNDDGASAITTFGVTLVAAIVSLAF